MEKVSQSGAATGDGEASMAGDAASAGSPAPLPSTAIDDGEASPTSEAADTKKLISSINDAVRVGEWPSTKEKIDTNKEEGINETYRTRVLRKLSQWTIFSVIVALLPIGINAYKAFVNGDPIDYTLISHGELVLVSAAIAAEAIGDIVVSGKTKGVVNMVAIGACLIAFFFSSAVFVIAESSPRRPDLIAASSGVVLLITFLAAGSCKARAES